MRAKDQKFKDELKCLSLFARQLTDSIIITDLSFKIVYVNHATEELYGYSRKELLGKTPGPLNAEPLSERIQRDIYKKVSSGKVWIGTHLNRRKDGSNFICELRIVPFLNKKGRLLFYIGIQRDITEQKRIKTKLAEIENRYYALFENVPVGVGLATKKGQVLAFNKMMTLLTGYSEIELEQINIRDMYVNLKDYVSVSRALKTKGTISNYEVELKKKNGEIYYASLTITPIKIGREEVKLTVAEDITERKKTEADLAKYREGLEKMVKERTAKLKDQKKALENKNIALREILGQLEIEKKKIEDNVVASIDNLVLPLLRKISKKKDKDNEKYLNILNEDLININSSFGKRLIKSQLKLSSREIEICDMIKSGLTTKEIAPLLNISSGTVDRHRENIRKKLKLTGENINLATFLREL